MRKTIVALVVGGLLAVSPGFAAEQSVQSRIDLNTVVSKRQAVDLLLAEALQIYKSPARISHAGFTAKMPSNMELVTERLLEAYRLEPYRTDLLISAANAQIYNGKIDRAVALFEQARAVAPDDVDINSYLAVWKHAQGDVAASRAHLARVAARSPGRAADLEAIFARVARISAAPLQDDLTPAQRAAARS